MGVIFQFVVLSISIIAILVAINRAKQGNVPTIRPIACLDALDELVGRSAEMGTPVHFITGASTMTGSEAPIVAAGFAILGYVAELCGKYQVPIRYTCMYGYTIPIAQDLIQRGYTKGGHPELYSDDMVYYVGETQNAIEAEIMGYLLKEKPAVNMMFGGIKYEALNTMGAAAVAGCIQAAGTPRLYYQPFLAACCDYSMIGDELYAAAAIADDRPEEKAIIQGEDVVKAIALVLILLSVVLSTIGAGDLFTQLITM